jgi:hypothetical protein
METMLKEFCPYIVVLATLERVGRAMSMWCEKVRQHTAAATRTHRQGYVGA